MDKVKTKISANEKLNLMKNEPREAVN